MKVVPKENTGKGFRAFLMKRWDEDTLKADLEAEKKLLERIAPYVSRVQNGELQLPYVLQPSSKPTFTNSSPGLIERGSIYGFSLRDYGSVDSETTDGPVELRAVSVTEEQLHRLRAKNRPIPVVEIVSHSEIYTRVNTHNGYVSRDYRDNIVQFSLSPVGILNIEDVIKRSWSSGYDPESKFDEFEFKLTGSERVSLIGKMNEKLEPLEKILETVSV